MIKWAPGASHQFLCARISQSTATIRHLKTDLFFQKRQLEFALRPEHTEALQQLNEESVRQHTKKIKTRQQRKFDRFLQQKMRCPSHSFTDKWVTNLSSRQLSVGENTVLAKGLNFAPTPRTIPIRRIVAAVEDGLRKLRTDQGKLEDARNSIIGILQKARPPPSNLSPEECRALSSLRRDSDIVILPADKGRSTVVMDRKNYDEKINNLLADQKTYKKLRRDPTPAFERRMNSQLLELKRSGAMVPSLYFRLRSSAGKVPLLYGLPKIHKPEVPLRPIVSFIGSPSYQLSKHLTHILSPLVGNTSSREELHPVC